MGVAGVGVISLCQAYPSQTYFVLLLSVLPYPLRGEDEAPKSFFQGLFRRFAFPPGTFLIFTPELTIPAWRDYLLVSKNGRVYEKSDRTSCEEDIFSKFDSKSGYPKHGREDDDIAAIKNSAIEIASPFYIYFDKLGWTHADSIYNMPPQVASFIQEYLVDPALQIFGVPPREQPVRTVNSGSAMRKTSPLLESHRLMLFRKIEGILEDVGIENGRACLLRAICEVNEFPLGLEDGEHGIFGEMLALLLRAIPENDGYEDAGQLGTKPCMSIYTRAALIGKNGNCLKYSNYCSHSIFQWSWSANLNKM